MSLGSFYPELGNLSTVYKSNRAKSSCLYAIRTQFLHPVNPSSTELDTDFDRLAKLPLIGRQFPWNHFKQLSTSPKGARKPEAEHVHSSGKTQTVFISKFSTGAIFEARCIGLFSENMQSQSVSSIIKWNLW